MRLAVLVIAAVLARSAAVAAQQATPESVAITVAEERSGPGGYTLITLRSRTIIAVMPSDLNESALRATATEPTCIAAARLTLVSGMKVVVPLTDMPDTSPLARAEGCPPPTNAGAARSPSGIAASPGAIPADSAALEQIRAQCAKEWGSDFRMRNFCEEQQLKALQELRRRR